MSTTANIVFITSGHSPFSSRLFSKELKSLQKKYPNLTIIAPFEEAKNFVDGIRIIGIKKYRSRYNRWSLLFSLYRHTASLRPQIVHCHEPDSLLVAYLLKKRFPEIKAIYDCHEFHPQSFTENFFIPIKNIACTIIQKSENWLASKMDAVITVNNLLVQRFKKCNKRVVLLPNYSRLNIFQKLRRKKEILSEKEVQLIYVGQLEIDRGFFTMLSILKEINQSYSCTLTLIGKFLPFSLEKELFRFASKHNLLDKIDYQGYLSHDDTVKKLINADIGLCLLKGKERYEWSEPIKYFEYAAAGLPVVMSDIPSHRLLIEKNKNGILVSGESPSEGKKVIKCMIEKPKEALKMAERGVEAFHKEYNWEAVEPRLFELYDCL